MYALKKRGELIARGRTAEVYSWAENQVLKLFFDWVSPESVQKEYEISRLAYQAKAPVPKVYDLVQEENRYGIIYERISGPTMLKLLISKPWRLKQLSHELAELHDSIHKISLDGMPSYRDRWFANIQRVANLPLEVKQKLMTCVDQIPAASQLCHFDFHPDQVVYSQRGVVILDWMTASCGDPAADIARTQILITIGKPPDTSWTMRILADVLGFLVNYYYQKRYLALNPAISREMIRAWLAPVAAVRLLEDIEHEAPRLMKMIEKLIND